MKSRIAEEKAKSSKRGNDWDRSTVASESKKPTLEDKMASQIAMEVLKDNQKLKGVHSNQSMKKILEREAKRQLLLETGGVFNPPVMAKLVERGRINSNDPSNLPYLHKHPAV